MPKRPEPSLFKDRFLDEATHAFLRRRKAIRNRAGELHIEPSPPDMLVVRFVPGAPRACLIVELFERNWLRVYVRSGLKHNRGKVVFRLQDVRIVGNVKRLVETFEWMLSELRDEDVRLDTSVADRWRQLVLESSD